MAVIECHSAKEWLKTLKERYDTSKTILRDSPDSFTVLISPNSNKTIIIARYDRSRSFGVVLDARKQTKSVTNDRRIPC